MYIERDYPDNASVLIYILETDVEYCLKMREENDSQFWRRSCVRAIFANVEGMVYSLKNSALFPEKFRGFFEEGKLSSGEIMLLQEKSYELHDTGKVKESSAKLRTLPNLKFAFSMYAKAFGIDNNTNYIDSGWEDFQKLQKIRDRLTHPKTSDALYIKNQEISIILNGFWWFRDSLSNLVNQVIAKSIEEAKIEDSVCLN